MPIKYICDMCGKETLINYVSERLKAKLGKGMVEVIAGVDGVWNYGVLCKECLIKIIKEGEPFFEP